MLLDCAWCHKLRSGRPPRMDFVQELKRIFEHGKAQFQNGDHPHPSLPKLSFLVACFDVCVLRGLTWMSLSVCECFLGDTLVQGVASATEIRLRIARFLALALDMGVMDEVSFERCAFMVVVCTLACIFCKFRSFLTFVECEEGGGTCILFAFQCG